MKISICIPFHQTLKTAFFLSRLLNSIAEQTYKNYEIILTAEGKFAENHNAAIKKSTGDIVKLMQMDDYFYHENALQKIVDAFTPDTQWLSSACLHNDGAQTFYPHYPTWSDDIYTGNNTLGSVSTLAMRRGTALLFEEPMTWTVDCDLYYRLYLKYGEPTILNDLNVVIQLREDSETNTLSDEVKQAEVIYLMKKYGK